MKGILNLIFLLLAFSAGAQSITMQGYVRDSVGNPLEMASVMATNEVTGKTDSYNITNSKGHFILRLSANTVYTVQVSYVGFKQQHIAITTCITDIVQQIVLEQGVELDNLEIVREMPVSIKGDTILYNSDSFTNGTERKLEDILKKLPGIEVNSDGQITAEGKTISKLMVDDKDFFDGDTKLGVKNIPADAVDKIEVLRNYSEVGQLKGVQDNQDNVAMNIKLKQGKKNFWFGDISAEAGPDERFAFNPKLFYYNPSYSVNILGNINNTGEQAFTISDYFRFTGGLKNLMSRGGTSFQMPGNEIQMLMMQNDKARQVISRFGAANFSYSPSKSWILSGFGIVSSTDTDMQFTNRNSILNPATGEAMTTQFSNRDVNQDTGLSIVKLSANYKPHKNFQMDYDVFLKASSQSENSSIVSTVMPDDSQSQDIYERKAQHPFSVNQNFNAYYTLNSKNIFAAELQHIYQDEDPFYNANLAVQPFSFEGYIPGQQRNNLNQRQFVTTNKLDAKFDYYYVVSVKSNFNITLANTYSYQNFNSGLYQLLDGGQINPLSTPQDTNNVNYVFNDASVGVHYKHKLGKFTLTPGVTIHNYRFNNTQQGSRVNQDYYKALPDFDAMWQIKKSETLRYNFSLTNFITDINSLAQGSVLTGYNSVYRGNRNLESALMQVHSINYSKFNTYNMESINVSFTYTGMVSPVSTLSAFDGINSVQTPYNSNFSNQNINGYLGYHRAIGKNYKAGVMGSVNWVSVSSAQPSLITQQVQERSVETFTQDYSASFSTNFSKLPSVTIGYGIRLNNYLNDTFYTNRPFTSLEYYFLNGFTVTSNYEFNRYTNKSKTADNKYDFLNASIAYLKKGGKLEYKTGVTNLLNTRTLNSDSYSQFSSTTSRYTVQPRYFLFSLIYKI